MAGRGIVRIVTRAPHTATVRSLYQFSHLNIFHCYHREMLPTMRVHNVASMRSTRVPRVCWLKSTKLEGNVECVGMSVWLPRDPEYVSLARNGCIGTLCVGIPMHREVARDPEEKSLGA